MYLRAVNAIDIIIHYQKMAKEKFYVVWEGVTPGVYTSWTDCQLQIKGYEGAKYQSFDTREEAERALTSSPYAYIGKNAKKKSEAARTGSDTLPASVIDNSLAVDAACSGNPGPMEYRKRCVEEDCTRSCFCKNRRKDRQFLCLWIWHCAVL